jgi:hypothetical protein
MTRADFAISNEAGRTMRTMARLITTHTILKQVNVIAPGIRLEGEITLPFALSCGTEFTAPGVQPSRSLMRYERVALVRPPKLSK